MRRQKYHCTIFYAPIGKEVIRIVRLKGKLILKEPVSDKEDGKW